MSGTIDQAISSGYNLQQSNAPSVSGAPSSSDTSFVTPSVTGAAEQKPRGFAAMDPEEQLRIARMGGMQRGKQLHEQAVERRRSKSPNK